MTDKPLVIAVMGPTASGKTDLAIGLRGVMDAELISVDSALVYRDMDIGTAKPTREELVIHPHRLVDIRDPSDSYSAAAFRLDAKREIKAVLAEGKTPILVGGSMLYFRALLEGLSDVPSADPQIRAKIEAQAQSEGWPEMHRRLSEVDPISAERLHPNHSQRISRALEVYEACGKPLSHFHGDLVGGTLNDYRWVQLAVNCRERKDLHARIEVRFDDLLERGFVEEVRQLKAREDLHAELPSMRAVGYRQIWDYLCGNYSYDEMREKGIIATRQLAKRQLTWLRSWNDIDWVFNQNLNGEYLPTEQIVDKALSFINERPG
ncbi:MAG: tRNA (adenosine(37)-N6)-dimethylallyltransferase MiaA [Alteromonadaceae bacterium]|nr:MAG: tRNA (adenosine(37)-N6)-dimethylallyltransferase MiaA [Alteromonadaceae bacterium]